MILRGLGRKLPLLSSCPFDFYRDLTELLLKCQQLKRERKNKGKIIFLIITHFDKGKLSFLSFLCRFFDVRFGFQERQIAFHQMTLEFLFADKLTVVHS